MTAESIQPVIEMKGITKIYPNGVVANKDVDFSVRPGEIHAVMGENGAGKSTLMKMLFGLEKIDKGQIFFKGNPVTIAKPSDAIGLKIGMVHQEFMLVPSLTVAENMMLREEPVKGIFIDRAKAIDETVKISEKYHLPIDPHARIIDLPVGMKQRVEILKALYRGCGNSDSRRTYRSIDSSGDRGAVSAVDYIKRERSYRDFYLAQDSGGKTNL